MPVMPIALFAAGMLFLTLPFWPLQILRGRGFREPFLVYICLLWFLSFFTGAFHFAVVLPLAGVELKFRFSSAIYVLIFAGLLFVYIAEGINEARKIIIVSIASQVFLVLFQLFLFFARSYFLGPQELADAERVLEPRAFNIAVSLALTIAMLFLAVVLFQFLVNRLPRMPLWFNMFAALWLTMMLDSAAFVGLTRPEAFQRNMLSHALFKSVLLLIYVFLLSFFLRRYRRDTELNLNRGALDIFKKLENLEKDLERAHAELKKYAENLEKMVEERTQEIRAKSEIMQRELILAAQVQSAMLPAKNTLQKLNLASFYRPCHEVSGDLYDYAELPDGRFFFFIADISGHGVPSALVGAMCKMSLGSQDFARTQPARILERLSEAMQKVSAGHYLTGTVLMIDPRKRVLEYANGGHIPCLLQDKRSTFLPLEATGTIIGSSISAPYDFRRIAYPANTRLVLMTDGIVEQKNAAREEFGVERLQQVLAETRSKPPVEVVNIIWQRAKEFAGTDQFSDDVTLIVVDLL
ncbi:MAG: PP2C family protein-serine/threonine phosphatase [Turneriella sp.]|nr:PP2C family protein-serine/threonine phosphatase [Leptospiraceae bacterium]MCX7633779.1 PP2C family protein-serine/threonine phosphatase [Turneriella sp.]